MVKGVNFEGKGENAGYQHFLLISPQFSRGILCRVVKSRDCVVKGEVPSFSSSEDFLLDLETFESTVTSDWLNHTFKFMKSWRKRQRML